MGEMLKVTKKLCKTCKYRTHLYDVYYCCGYILAKGFSRQCPEGLCDKYEKGVPKNARSV